MMTKKFMYSAINEAAADAAAGADDSQVVNPSTVQVTNPATGQVIVAAGQNALPAGIMQAAPVASAQNASSALTLVTDQRLTQFSVGYPQDELESVADFISPPVASGLKFSYQVQASSNAYGTVADDVTGINGLPALVTPDDNSLVETTLKFRGLESQMGSQEMQAFDGVPGWSADQEWQDRIQLMIDWQRRGKIQRVLAVAAAAAGGATAKTWNAAADPIGDLRGYINTIAKLVGGRQNIRLLIGSDAWEIVVNHVKLAGGTNYPRQIIDESTIARMVGVLPGNIKINYLQVTATKQGKTPTITDLLTPAELWIFAANQTPNRRDPSFMKTFYMNTNGAARYIYTYNPHPLFVRKGAAYWEHIAATNSAAVKRLTIASS